MAKTKKNDRKGYLLAGGAALLGAILMQRHVAMSTRQPEQERERETYRVVAAARDLEAGTELGPEDLKFLPVRMDRIPRHIFDAGRVVDAPEDAQNDTLGDSILSRMIGRTLGVNLSRNDLILATDFEEGIDVSLGSALSEKQRAVSVNVDPSALMGGLVLPNDRVDVIAFYRAFVEEQGVRRETFTRAKVVLKNITVLAVGGRLSRMSEGGAGSRDSSVVLGLTPDQALALSLVQRNAKISLLLRPNDPGVPSGDYTQDELVEDKIDALLKSLTSGAAQNH